MRKLNIVTHILKDMMINKQIKDFKFQKVCLTNSKCEKLIGNWWIISSGRIGIPCTFESLIRLLMFGALEDRFQKSNLTSNMIYESFASYWVMKLFVGGFLKLLCEVTTCRRSKEYVFTTIVSKYFLNTHVHCFSISSLRWVWTR